MEKKNGQTVKIIFSVYLAVTLVLLCFGYGVEKPAVRSSEFPFTVTYLYQGKTETITDVFVAEYSPRAQYLGDHSVSWYGYVKDRDRLEYNFYRIGEDNGYAFSINLNLEPGFLMGDPAYAGTQCIPTGAIHTQDGENDIVITDPEEMEKLGFSVISWEYPQPIENTFSFGGFSLSSEATIYTTVIALVSLLMCMILVRKEPDLMYSLTDKFSAVLNFLMAIVVFPFVFMLSVLSEIVADVTVAQQFLYLAPAITVMGIAASVVLRRSGKGKFSLPVQFLGPAVVALVLLAESI